MCRRRMWLCGGGGVGGGGVHDGASVDDMGELIDGELV